ncbi:MAG: FAD-binding oxidoreductase [Gammaproteobacteria bacterium]|nr:FAD-binding oxidoreductase [Gammaproteobacteria bacterium]MCP4879106.1 FAD-binding oxidoreductase [Gammaproteobacteria bacterium]MDP6164555.1 FAD-binding oxidoreductase [Gammaproteobacteria bacterium]
MTPEPNQNPIFNRPYWWDFGSNGQPLQLKQLAASNLTLPSSVDCVIVGAGYSGLSAALTLARAGRSVAVVDSQHPGYGCSARNGGLIGPSFHKLGLAGLNKQLGRTMAEAIIQESMDCLLWLKQFIREENIDCGLHETGRFRGAVAPKHYENLAQQAESLHRLTGLNFEMVPKSSQHQHIGSDFYHGGIVYHQDGHLHPGSYLKGLANAALRAGAGIYAPAQVTGINTSTAGYEVKLTEQSIQCGQVLIATNGYTDKNFPYLRRRIVPIRSGIIVTEPLSSALMSEVTPKLHGFGDTSRLVPYYRPTPDGQRLLFGGRAFDTSDQPSRYVPDLQRLMLRIFPQLRATQITHAWSGTVAYTFDHAPHLGQIDKGKLDGVFYVMGYCGSGVGRASWFGRKAALQMLGDTEGNTPIDQLTFKGRPLYSGNPWFLPLILRWHSLIDRFQYRR